AGQRAGGGALAGRGDALGPARPLPRAVGCVVGPAGLVPARAGRVLRLVGGPWAVRIRMGETVRGGEALRSRALPPGGGRVGEGGRMGGGRVRSQAGPAPLLSSPLSQPPPSQGGGTLRRPAAQIWNRVS